MQTAATLKNYRLSPRKCRLAADFIRGKGANAALDMLKFKQDKASSVVRKVLLSAIANAENNFSADIDMMRIQSIMVDKGKVWKRFKVRARGRSSPILKRCSHIKIVVISD